MPQIGEDIWVLEGDKPYQCRVVNRAGRKVEVHFKNWNRRYDVWIDEDSERIVDGPGGKSLVDMSSGDVTNGDEENTSSQEGVTGGTSLEDMKNTWTPLNDPVFETPNVVRGVSIANYIRFILRRKSLLGE